MVFFLISESPIMQLTTSSTNALIQKCLAKHFSLTQIAEILGVTPSAVSQQISQHGLAAQPSTSADGNLFDNLLDETESKVLARLARSVESNPNLNPLHLTKILQTLNAAKRKVSLSQTNVQPSEATATLVLPQFILNQTVVINENNEVKEVGGVLLESLPANNVKDLFSPTSNSSNVELANAAAHFVLN